MARFGDFIVINRKRMLWIMAIVSLILLAFIPRIQIDDSFLKFYDEHNAFRQDTEFAGRHLIGPYPVEYLLSSGSDNGISDTIYLKNVEAFSNWLRQQPEVVHVYSYTDIIKSLNRSLHGDLPEAYRLPESRELAAQYLLLYEMSLPYGLELNNMIDINKSSTRLTAALKELSSKKIKEFSRRAETWPRDHAPKQMHAQTTGPVMMFVTMTERNAKGMLTGTALAFVLISMVLLLALRNVKLGIVSLIPNFIPVMMAFGLWGILYQEIGLIASFITATTLGLIVDDTVHILSKYNRARHEHHLNSHDSIRYSFSHVGSALLVTSFILIAGFLVLTLSDFMLNSDLGLLTAITIGFALMTDFLLLPPLLMWLDKNEAQVKKEAKEVRGS